MKRIILSIMISTGILISSCHKDAASANTSNNGSWSLKGSTYVADSCTTLAPMAGVYYPLSAKTVLNSSTVNTTFSELNIIFGVPPTANSTYTAVNDSVYVNVGLTATQAYVNVSVGGLTSGQLYETTGTGTISATVSGTGKISASSISGIEVLNISSPFDSAKLTFNITQ
jgi:hypothetical protein